MAPSGLIRPILLPCVSVNHKFPSGPAAIPTGLLDAVRMGNSVIVPEGVIRPMLFAPDALWVNHMFPSGPAAIEAGNETEVGIGNSVITPGTVAADTGETR
jgi:hypothetical protein